MKKVLNLKPVTIGKPEEKTIQIKEIYNRKLKQRSKK
jgi:hypothetical protein